MFLFRLFSLTKKFHLNMMTTMNPIRLSAFQVESDHDQRIQLIPKTVVLFSGFKNKTRKKKKNRTKLKSLP